MAIDMWSFGCIMAELFLGYPVFPGENEVEQMAMFMEVLGKPRSEFISVDSLFIILEMSSQKILLYRRK